MRYGKRPWVVILAGGDGKRLQPVTTEESGRPVPKQFCRLDGRESMLGLTIARARNLTDPGRIVVSVLEQHRQWWKSELDGIDLDNVIRQARNRGTGFALHVALLQIRAIDPCASVVVMASDHMVDEEPVLLATIQEAVAATQENDGYVVLLGAAPHRPDPSLGWIRPGRAVEGRVCTVLGFMEKPDAATSGMCMRAGWYVNTMILAASVHALLDVYERVLPTWWLAFWRDEGLPYADVRRLAALPPAPPRVDLSKDLLPQATECLRVLPLPECGWTDVGTIDRLKAWWASHPVALERVQRRGVF